MTRGCPCSVVRQQAKELSNNARKKPPSSESKAVRKSEKEKKPSFKENQVQSDFAKEEFEESFKPVGSSHHIISLQEACDALLKEKQELQNEIARARGAIAEERIKVEKCFQKEKNTASIGRKNLVRKMENLRSTMISNLPSTRGTGSTKQSVRVQVHRGADESDDMPGTSCGQSGKSPKCPPKKPVQQISSHSKRKKTTLSDCEEDDESDDSDVTWPPRSARVVKGPIPSRMIRFYDHSTRVTKDCPQPPYNIISADPCDQPDMSEMIADEEEAFTRKENLDILARRENLIRGNKALRKEREKKEAEMLLKEISEVEKRRRIQEAVSKSYPSKIHSREEPGGHFKRSEWTRGSMYPVVEEDSDSGVAAVTKGTIPASKDIQSTCHSPERNITTRRDFTPTAQFIPPLMQPGTEELLEDLIEKLKEERAKKQKNLESRFGVCGLREEDVPSWIPLEPTSDPNTELTSAKKWEDILDQAKFNLPDQGNIETERRPFSVSESREKSPTGFRNSIHSGDVKQNKCACSEKCYCTQDYVRESLGDDHNIENVDRQATRMERSMESPNKKKDYENRKHSREGKTLSPSIKPVSSKETSSSTSDSSSQPETLKSSLTYEGVKVTIKMSDKKKKPSLKAPQKTRSDKDIQTSLQNSPNSVGLIGNKTNEVKSSSTSYRSLPSSLSPEHQALLRNVMSRIDPENVNHRLHSYITRLLDLTHDRIENLPVSSVSDVSLGSCVFECTENCQNSGKCDESCQASFGACPCDREVLKFTELAKGYATRVRDLTSMLESIKILPCQPRKEPEDTTYMNLPDAAYVSLKFSDSVQKGCYPRPLEATDISLSPPSASNTPLPQGVPPYLFNEYRKPVYDPKPQYLSTIQETEYRNMELSQVDEAMFDPDVSSIKGSPVKTKDIGTSVDSATSSLCLLNEKDMGSSFFGSSSDDYEDVFRSLGIAWALPTVRKVRESRRKADSTSSSGGQGGHYSHSTPLTRSPARISSSRPSPSKTSRLSPAKTSSKPNSNARSDRICDSDSLTPPSYTLNIPRLSRYLSQSPQGKGS